jgi:hypothetical protein
MAAPDGLIEAVRASAGRLGISPSDLLTAISYETGGTLDPWKAGPTTQWGQHRGLIQWGEPQRQKYGVTKDMPVADQMRAAERYLIDAGVKPGHGLLDVYSAINAGRVGLYNRSDANNGGAPGTVADKVAGMAGHRMRANALLGMAPGEAPAQSASLPAPAGPAPLSLAPSALPDASAVPGATAPAGDDALQTALAGLQAVPGALAQESAEPMPMLKLDPIHYVRPAGLAKAKALAQAMSNRQLG